MFSDDIVVVMGHSWSDGYVCSSAWRGETASLRQVPQHVREYYDGRSELRPRGGRGDGNAEYGKRAARKELRPWREEAVEERSRSN